MRKNNAFVAKIANTHLTKICVAISERLSTSATLGLADNGGPQILRSRGRAQRRGNFFQLSAIIALFCCSLCRLCRSSFRSCRTRCTSMTRRKEWPCFVRSLISSRCLVEDLVSWAPIEMIFVLTILTLFVDQVFDFLKMPREDPDNPEIVRSIILDFLSCSLYLSTR